MSDSRSGGMGCIMVVLIIIVAVGLAIIWNQ